MRLGTITIHKENMSSLNFRQWSSTQTKANDISFTMNQLADALEDRDFVHIKKLFELAKDKFQNIIPVGARRITIANTNYGTSKIEDLSIHDLEYFVDEVEQRLYNLFNRDTLDRGKRLRLAQRLYDELAIDKKTALRVNNGAKGINADDDLLSDEIQVFMGGYTDIIVLLNNMIRRLSLT